MNCEKAFEEMLADAPASKELKGHLAQCQDCASLARHWERLKSVGPKGAKSPPTETDFRICSAAIVKAQSLKRRKAAVRAAIWFLASAASLAVCISLSIHLASTTGAGAPQGASVASSAKTQRIAWDSVEFGEGLRNLSLTMETTAASLDSGPQSQAKSEQTDDFPSIDIEIPDLTT